ncbi:tandem-95 repeat protein [Bradyrhizobium sp. TZ2]
MSIERVEIVIIPGAGNTGPTAGNDSANTVEDAGVTISMAALLSNDTDPDGDSLTLLSVQSPSNGTVERLASGDVLFTPAANFSGTASFTYTVRDAAGATSTATVFVNVAPVADGPQATVSHASGNEDLSVALNITAALTDVSEVLSITITNVPQGAALSAGIAGGDGTWTLTPEQLAGLTLDPPENFSGTIELGVIATSTESDGTTAQTSNTLTITVAAVADQPDIAAVSTSISALSADDIVPLGLTLSHGDSSEILTIEVQGVTPAYMLSSGTNMGDGVWLVDAGAVETLALVRVGGDAPVGELNLTVVVTAQDGASFKTDTINLSIDVSSPEPERRLVDGYIVGATVFSDTDRDGVLDEGEAFAVTGENGTFTLVGVDDANAPLVSIGGIDVSTGLAFEGVLTAPGGSTVITPLTTLVQALVESGSTVTAANALVATALGITAPAEGFTNYDPIPDAQSGGPDAANATAILAAAIQVQATITQIAAAVGGEDAGVASALAQVISESGTLDLTQQATLAAIVDTVAPDGADTNALASVTSVVLAANQAIETAAAGGVDNLAKAANVALGQTTEALAQAGLDATALDVVESDNTGGALDQAIAAAEIPDAFQIGTLGNDILTGTAGVDVIEGLDGNDQIDGQGGNDALSGGAGKDVLSGGEGDDLLDGGAGQDRAIYSAATTGITVNLAAGTASGAGVGTDTLVDIEGIIGSDFADTFNAAGFTGSTGLPGIAGGQNAFEGRDGDDLVIGALNPLGQAVTRVEYLSASEAVTVDIAAGTGQGTVAGDIANVGHDTFSNVSTVWGSDHNDTIYGSDNASFTYETYEGRGSDDYIDGRGGYDSVTYNNDPETQSGITVHLAAGTVNGDASVGIDTIRNVEAARGTNFDDVFDATGYGLAGALNVSTTNGNFNDFGGAGGNDTIIGNGNTRLNYQIAAASVTVDLETSTGTAITVAGSATGATEGDRYLHGRQCRAGFDVWRHAAGQQL